MRLMSGIIKVINMVSFLSNKRRDVDKSCMRVSTPAATTLTTAGDYYQVAGTFGNGCSKNFTVAADGTVTYTGIGAKFLFSGVSDLQVDKACEITYALEKNSVIDTTSQTPHTFTAASKIDGIAITRIVSLVTGDVLKVMAKSDTNTTSMTANTLFLTFMGEN